MAPNSLYKKASTHKARIAMYGLILAIIAVAALAYFVTE